jgi:hypothetical protein
MKLKGTTQVQAVAVTAQLLHRHEVVPTSLGFKTNNNF